MEGMKEFPDKYFDLAIVDPPYGMMGWTFRSKDKQWTKGFASAALDKSETSVAKISLGKRPNKLYFDELFRVSINQIIFGMQYFTNYLFPTQCVLVWDKQNGTNRFSDFELMWTSFNFGTRIINRWSDKINRIHPTQKPTMLYGWLLTNYAKTGDKILDTHVGSGSSIIAFEKHGFEYCGFEIDKDYYDSSMKRIEKHRELLKQEKIFQSNIY